MHRISQYYKTWEPKSFNLFLYNIITQIYVYLLRLNECIRISKTTNMGNQNHLIYNISVLSNKSLQKRMINYGKKRVVNFSANVQAKQINNLYNNKI